MYFFPALSTQRGYIQGKQDNMMAKLCWAVLLSCWQILVNSNPGAAAAPVVSFYDPPEGSVVFIRDDRDKVHVHGQIHEREHYTQVIVQVDGVKQFELDCGSSEPCTFNIFVSNLDPGWHGIGVIMISTDPDDIPIIASPFSFYLSTNKDTDTNLIDIYHPPDLYLPDDIQDIALARPSNTQPGNTSHAAKKRNYVINVIAFDRPKDITRLLNSLEQAKYEGETVHLNIVIDAAKPDSTTERLLNVQRVLNTATDFNWSHGIKTIQKKVTNNGVAAQWLEAWMPAHDSDIGFFFEEDLEVSPAYFLWVKRALEKYEHTPVGRRLFGLCLQRQWLVPARYLAELRPQTGHRPFLYQVLGPLGFVGIGSMWRQFVSFYEEVARDPSYLPLVDGLWTNEWVKGGRRDVWTSWHDRWAQETGTFCLYPNAPAGQALVVNHAGPGLHYQGTKKNGVDAVLVDLTAPWARARLFRFPDAPQVFDFSGRAAGHSHNSMFPIGQIAHSLLQLPSTTTGTNDASKAINKEGISNKKSKHTTFTKAVEIVYNTMLQLACSISDPITGWTIMTENQPAHVNNITHQDRLLGYSFQPWETAYQCQAKTSISRSKHGQFSSTHTTTPTNCHDSLWYALLGKNNGACSDKKPISNTHDCFVKSTILGEHGQKEDESFLLHENAWKNGIMDEDFTSDMFDDDDENSVHRSRKKKARKRGDAAHHQTKIYNTQCSWNEQLVPRRQQHFSGGGRQLEEILNNNATALILLTSSMETASGIHTAADHQYVSSKTRNVVGSLQQESIVIVVCLSDTSSCLQQPQPSKEPSKGLYHSLDLQESIEFSFANVKSSSEDTSRTVKQKTENDPIPNKVGGNKQKKTRHDSKSGNNDYYLNSDYPHNEKSSWTKSQTINSSLSISLFYPASPDRGKLAVVTKYWYQTESLLCTKHLYELYGMIHDLRKANSS